MVIDTLGNNIDFSSDETVFTTVYDRKIWGIGSGIGSDPNNAEPYIYLLQKYFNNPNYTKIVDLGCGDWRLMQKINIPTEKDYHGYDVVPSVIETNIKTYSKENIKFYQIHKISEFENVTGDLLIVKDVIMHWPNAQVQYFIDKILPKFNFTLITNDYSKFSTNEDIRLGAFREIDLALPPFNLNLQLLFDYPSHGSLKRVYLYSNSTENNLMEQ